MARRTRKLRMGMVGGGPGAFIGPVHRIAAEMDGKIELVAGAFSQSAERSREAGVSFRIDPARAYADYRQMIEAESKRAGRNRLCGDRDARIICICPLRWPRLDAGIPVMSDKPATATYEEALELEAAVTKSGLPYGLTHTYAGYAMVREARAMCAAGKLGKIRKVAVEYFQGWLSGPLETTGHKQAEWRADPARSGAGGAIGDIGTHAFHLLEYISGLQVTAINATLRTVVPGRKLDDDCNAFVRMSNGAAGTLACSQVAAGEMNELRLRIYGENGSLEWRQQDPNRLIVKWSRQARGDSSRGGELSGQRCAGGGAGAGGASGRISGSLRCALSRVCRCAYRVEAREDESAAGHAAGNSSGRARHAIHRARDREQPQRSLGGVLDCELPGASF